MEADMTDLAGPKGSTMRRGLRCVTAANQAR